MREWQVLYRTSPDEDEDWLVWVTVDDKERALDVVRELEYGGIECIVEEINANEAYMRDM